MNRYLAKFRDGSSDYVFSDSIAGAKEEAESLWPAKISKIEVLDSEGDYDEADGTEDDADDGDSDLDDEDSDENPEDEED